MLTVMILITTLTFPSQVLLKEHRDSIQMLSLEYARLLKQNEKLKNVIKGRGWLQCNVHCKYLTVLTL